MITDLFARLFLPTLQPVTQLIEPLQLSAERVCMDLNSSFAVR
ncbi:hypothetical protein [Magnetococcus marinus]|nr:hypothetical protein [Magnetococcus marinus]